MIVPQEIPAAVIYWNKFVLSLETSPKVAREVGGVNGLTDVSPPTLVNLIIRIPLDRYQVAVKNGMCVSFICKEREACIPWTTEVTRSFSWHNLRYISYSIWQTLKGHMPPPILLSDKEDSGQITQRDDQDILNAPFDISDREIWDPEETHERSVAEKDLSTSVLHGKTVRYQLFENGSKRGKPLLVCTDRFIYSIKFEKCSN